MPQISVHNYQRSSEYRYKVPFNIGTANDLNRLARALGQVTGDMVIFQRDPGYMYAAGKYSLTVDGSLLWPENFGVNGADQIINGLGEYGFRTTDKPGEYRFWSLAELRAYYDKITYEPEYEPEHKGYTVQLPLEQTILLKTVIAMTSYIADHKEIITKLLSCEFIYIKVIVGEAGYIEFPWFEETTDRATKNAYRQFARGLYEHATKANIGTTVSIAIKEEKDALEAFGLMMLNLGLYRDENTKELDKLSKLFIKRYMLPKYGYTPNSAGVKVKI